MSKSKRNLIIAVVVLILLAAAIAVLAIVNRPDAIPETGTLDVVNGESRQSLSMADIRELDYIEVEKEIVSSSFANDEGLFRGVALRELLKAAGVDMSAAAQVVVRSEDGFVSAFPADEVTDSDSIFLAYSKNGEGLGTLEDGGSGPFRIVVTDDDFGNRCAKYVCEIEVK